MHDRSSDIEAIIARETRARILYRPFVLPRSGEFYCELGEHENGERSPLLIDDYCMK